MKIDLRKDRGILEPVIFLAGEGTVSEQSEDELIAETLRRRHGGAESEPDIDQEQTEESSTAKKQKPKKSGSFRPVLLMLLLISMLAGGYYINEQGLYKPYVAIVDDYWCKLLGFSSYETVEPWSVTGDSVIQGDGVLSDDLFNELMPITDDIAALVDSIAAQDPDSLYGTAYLDETPSDTITEEYLPVAEAPIQLSDNDIIIINNRSLLLMLTEIINDYPDKVTNGHIFLKRDGLTITAPAGGVWTESVKTTLDEFVLGTFVKDFSKGNAVVKSKFEIIMNAEQEFQAQVLDGLRLLDVLANPFDDYLEEILIDLSKGVDDNPAVFTFGGSRQEIQFILSSWAESRSNFILRSVDIKFKAGQLILSFDITFFNYTP